MQYCPVAKYHYVHNLWQSVRGDSKHFDVLDISWKWKHFWANCKQGINSSYNSIKFCINKKYILIFIFAMNQNYPLAWRVKLKNKCKVERKEEWKQGSTHDFSKLLYCPMGSGLPWEGALMTGDWPPPPRIPVYPPPPLMPIGPLGDIGGGWPALMAFAVGGKNRRGRIGY